MLEKAPHQIKHASCGLLLHQHALQLAARPGTLKGSPKMLLLPLATSLLLLLPYSLLPPLLLAYYFINKDMPSCLLLNFTQPQSEKRGENEEGVGWSLAGFEWADGGIH